MRRILIATDGPASSYVTGNFVLTWEPDLTRVLIEFVYFEPLGDLRSYAGLPHAQERKLEARAARAIDRAEARLRDAGAQVKQHVVAGAIGDTILRIASESPVEEIVMRSRGRSLLRQLAAGSVPADVLADAALPVTLVRGGGEKHSAASVGGPRRVLAVLEAGPGRRVVLDYVRALIERARDVAAFGAILPADRQGAAADPASAEVPGWLTSRTLEARTARAVADEAARLGCQRIVLAALGRQTFAHLLGRSLAHAVVRAAPAAITLIRVQEG